MTNPALSSELTIKDPAHVWQPRQPYQNNATASGSDNSGFVRATMQDGQVRIETNGKQVGSTREANEAQNQAAGVPFDYATDPRTGCRLSPYDLQENSIVYFGESSMTIAQARAAEMLPPGWQRPGTYPDQVQAQQQSRRDEARGNDSQRPLADSQEQQQEEVHPDLQMEALADEQADRDFSALVDSTGGVEQLDAIKQIVQDGQIDARTLGTLASQTGCEPQQLQERIAPIMQAFEQQARAVMSVGGLDSNDVVAFAQQNCPDKLRNAMNKQATMRQTSGYAEIRDEYLAGLGEHNPSKALNAELGNGITQYQDSKGRVMVRIPGMSDMLWSTAIKSFGVSKS